MQLQKDLLAGDFGRNHPLGHVGKLVLGKQPRTLRQGAGEISLEIADSVSGIPRDHEDRVEPAFLRQHVDEAEQAAAPNQIDLVQSEDRFAAMLGEAVEDPAGIPVHAACCINQKHRSVGILGA